MESYRGIVIEETGLTRTHQYRIMLNTSEHPTIIFTGDYVIDKKRSVTTKALREQTKVKGTFAPFDRDGWLTEGYWYYTSDNAMAFHKKYNSKMANSRDAKKVYVCIDSSSKEEMCRIVDECIDNLGEEFLLKIRHNPKLELRDELMNKYPFVGIVGGNATKSILTIKNIKINDGIEDLLKDYPLEYRSHPHNNTISLIIPLEVVDECDMSYLMKIFLLTNSTEELQKNVRLEIAKRETINIHNTIRLVGKALGD